MHSRPLRALVAIAALRPPRRLRGRRRPPARGRRHGRAEQQHRRVHHGAPVPARTDPADHRPGRRLVHARDQPGHERARRDPRHRPAGQVRDRRRALRPRGQLLHLEGGRRHDLQRGDRQRRRRGRRARDRARRRAQAPAALGDHRVLGSRGGRAARLAGIHPDPARAARRHRRLRELRHPGRQPAAGAAQHHVRRRRRVGWHALPGHRRAPRRTRRASTPTSSARSSARGAATTRTS